MKTSRLVVLTVVILHVLIRCAGSHDSIAFVGEYLGQEKPDDTPVFFAPGIVSTEHHEHSAPAFTPDGREIYWSTFPNKQPPQVILFVKCIDGEWTAPQAATFSGEHSDGGPSVSPDGHRLFFNSSRPAVEGESEKEDQDIWYVSREGAGWSEAKRLNDRVNTGANEASPSVSENGTVYFQSDREGGMGKDDLYSSRCTRGRYQPPENLGSTINSESWEDYPFIAPDESYIVFCASDREDGFGYGDLYVSWQEEDGTWGDPIHLGEGINSASDDRFPAVSPDGEYLFFVSERSGNSEIYWVDASAVEKTKG